MSRIETLTFAYPEGDRTKTVYVYLPDISPKQSPKMPLLIMHDGHNLFFPETSAFGETWKAKETLDELAKKEGTKLIVAGIAEPSYERFHQYSPFVSKLGVKFLPGIGDETAGGKGDTYLSWVVQTIIPYFQSHYAIDSDNLFMAGSSMGGFISLYAAYRYPGLFAKVGVFSPAMWFAEGDMLSYIETHHRPFPGIYLDIGTSETSNPNNPDFPHIYLSGAKRLFRLLKKLGTTDLLYVEEADATHSENAWARRFPKFCEWLLTPRK